MWKRQSSWRYCSTTAVEPLLKLYQRHRCKQGMYLYERENISRSSLWRKCGCTPRGGGVGPARDWLAPLAPHPPGWCRVSPAPPGVPYLPPACRQTHLLLWLLRQAASVRRQGMLRACHTVNLTTIHRKIVAKINKLRKYTLHLMLLIILN